MKKNKESESSNDSIKCDVESCKHQNEEEGTCTLEEIKISCTCDNCDCTNKDETICKSFDCKDEQEMSEDDTSIENEDEDQNQDDEEDTDINIEKEEE